MKFELQATSLRKLNEFDKEKFGFKKDEDGDYIGPWHIDFEPPIIEINTLEELVEFGKKYGTLILRAKDSEIEIYNDYRE